MKLSSISIVALLTLTACTKSTEVDCESETISAPHIILVAGQSNTHAGLGLDESIDTPEDGIYQLGRFENDMCIIQACEPLDHHTKTQNMIGFALTFAKLLKQHENGDNDILIIPCGFGGTGFMDNRWNKTNDLYEDAVARVNHVLETYPGSELTAVLWHQGETDVVLNNPDYAARLDAFINNLRADIGADQIPLIVGGMVPYWVQQVPDREATQAIIADTPNRHNKVGYADPTVPFVIEKPDNTFDEIHFSAAGQRELAQRYFTAYLEIIE